MPNSVELRSSVFAAMYKKKLTRIDCDKRLNKLYKPNLGLESCVVKIVESNLPGNSLQRRGCRFDSLRRLRACLSKEQHLDRGIQSPYSTIYASDVILFFLPSIAH